MCQSGRARRAGQLDGRRADAAAHRVDQDALAHLQTSLREQSIVRGHKDFGNASSLHKVQVIWHLN